jgi:hypothetical protein
MKIFIENFIKRKGYSQNRLVDAKGFIKLAEDWGVRIELTTLESLEKQKLLVPAFRYIPQLKKQKYTVFRKNGKEFCKLKGIKLKTDEEYVCEKTETYFTVLDNSQDHWKESSTEGYLYEPIERGYEKWDSLTKDEGNSKISYYSNFQLYWLLHIIEGLQREVGTLNEEVHIPDREWLEKVTQTEKLYLQNSYKRFHSFLKFLLLSQSAFYPYARSGGRTIVIHGDDEEWNRLKKEYNFEKTLDILELEEQEILYWYRIFVSKAEDLLGGSKVNSYGWFQLWKNISWNKKKYLKGNIRAGIDVLQWALMMKAILEYSKKQEIPDIDEISNYGYEDIQKIPLNRWGGSWSMRYIRNWRNLGLTKFQYEELNRLAGEISKSTDKTSIEESFKPYKRLGFYIDWGEKSILFDDTKLKIKNYYKDRYRQTYYRANSFGLDFQPRVLLFVEGPTEERVIPEVMRWYYMDPSEIGVDIIGIGGVSNWFGGEFNLKEQFDSKPKKKLLSNFKALLTYNLNRWQVIPYLVADNEGNLHELMKEGISLEMLGEELPINTTSKIVYIWGVTNENKPFEGESFEFANFKDEEISIGLKKYLQKKVNSPKGISSSSVRRLRKKGVGIQTIHNSKYENIINKPELTSLLFSQLRTNYEDKKVGKEIFERPIFKMLDSVISHANLNHQPTDWIMEETNKHILKEIISGER